MKNAREWLWAILGVVLAAIGVALILPVSGQWRDVVLPDACRSPVRILEPRTTHAMGSAVVFHGLSANRRIMQTAGQWLAANGLRVYLVDSPGHGDSTEPFSFAHAEECGGAALDSLARRGEIMPERTVLVGHSMGGAVAIRLADQLPTAATIALSPAPMVKTKRLPPSMLRYSLPRRMPINLLVLYGTWEPRSSIEAQEALLRAAGGARVQAEDFEQRRAVWLDRIPSATHTSLIFDLWTRGWVVDWSRHALNIHGEHVHYAGSPVLGGVLGIAGLALVFPLAASRITALFGAEAREPAAAQSAALWPLAQWTVVALAAVIALRFWVPLRVLRLYTGDYLASFFLLAGAALAAWQWQKAKSALRFPFRSLAAACVLGLVTILGFGAWIHWQLYDGLMNAARWMRFVPLVALCLPYHAAEELAMGTPGSGRRWRRLGLFLALRSILWGTLALGIFALGSDQILVLLLAIFLALFSILQRWGMDAVRRRTGSPGAAAIFGAILAAWFLAGVFPLR